MNVKIINKSNNLYCRLISGRQIDISKKIGISIPLEHWDIVNQKIKNSYKLANKDKINSKLLLLKSKITDQYNFDNINGEVIDSDWLAKAIDEAFNRRATSLLGKTISHEIYFYDFCANWIENESENVNLSSQKQYSVFVKNHLINYLKEYNISRIKIKEVSSQVIRDFVTYMLNENYAPESVKRQATRFKFFLNRADNMNLEVNRNYRETIKVAKEKENVKEVYLNEIEIEQIYNLDYSDNKWLDDIRDNFIIGLCTGLRLSDFNNNLNQSNIIDDFIEIKAQKTGISVAIPMHKYIVEILYKRNGELPPTVSDVTFNKSIKQICQDGGINEITRGYVWDNENKRNKLDYFEKYKLVSSHICRRSFATNLYGKVPNNVIQAVGGWTNEKMMLHYIKKSNREHATELKRYWDANNN